jgi:hypothetical protein
VTVTVVDKTPPSIGNVTANPNLLWPPNHKIVQVNVNLSVSDNCDAKPVCKITSVNSNEPVNGPGDGNTATDWQVIGNLSLNLRAERSGKGNGRTYTIAITCSDASENSATRSVSITVPKDHE